MQEPSNAVLATKIDALSTQINSINLAINGNGRPENGISQRLTRLEDSVAHCQSHWKEHKEDKKMSISARATIFAATIASVTSIIVALIALYKG